MYKACLIISSITGTPGDDDDDDDDDGRDREMCPDLVDVIQRCGGAGCIRRPLNNETCIQCREGCTG